MGELAFNVSVLKYTGVHNTYYYLRHKLCVPRVYQLSIHIPNQEP